MSQSNARNYLDTIIHNSPKEEELRQIEDNEELLDRVVTMARDENWPTGEFNVDDCKAAGTAIVREQGTYETFISAWRREKTIW